MGIFLLPESHKGERRPLRREALNPLASFRWVRGMTVIAALMAVFFIMQLVGQAPATLWVIFGEDRFHWDTSLIGISLAAFGILHSLAPGNDHRPCNHQARRKAGTHARNDCRRRRLHPACLGDKGMDGVPDYGPACFGWHRNAGAASSVVEQVDEERQGQLQGSLAALTSLTSIVGPLLFTAIYAASITTWNGWAWIAGAALYLLCLPALRRGFWSGVGQRADR